MSRIHLTMACSGYDRVRALADGRVQPDGIELNFLRLPIDETLFRMVRHHEFDVSEMSLSSYVLSLFDEHPPFVAIPAFVSRTFRHSFIFVNSAAGISGPGDLRSRRIGLPEYQLTSCVWIRGILAEHYGVPADAVTYHTGGQENPGRVEKSAVHLPPGIVVAPIPADRTLSQMLAAGDIDALYSTRIPSTFGSGDGAVTRLFANYREEEQAYYERTRIFPIMHVIVIKRALYEQNRWIAASLMKAFAAARDIAIAELDQNWALNATLPWLTAEMEHTRRIMGRDYWSYGLGPNRHVLETFLGYSHRQGLASAVLAPERLFAPETLESYVI